VLAMVSAVDAVARQRTGTRDRSRAVVPSRRSCDLTGHPAGGRYLSGQVSWLTGHGFGSGLPNVRRRQWHEMDLRLAAHSCGGSAGITPASLLAPHRPEATRRTSTASWDAHQTPKSRNT